MPDEMAEEYSGVSILCSSINVALPLFEMIVCGEGTHQEIIRWVIQSRSLNRAGLKFLVCE